MNVQTEFGEAYARWSDPVTSHEAAEHVAAEQANRLEQLVVNALRNHPAGLTNHELVEITGVNWNTISPRVRPLVRKGLVRDSGLKRIGPSGRSCIVWTV